MIPIQTFTYPNGKNGIYIYKSGFQSTSKIFRNHLRIMHTKHKLDSDEGRSVLLIPVRNPVDRFVSAVDTVRKNKKYSEYSVNDFLKMLEENTFRNLHFMRTSDAIKCAVFCFDDFHLYKFPEHYKNMLNDGGYYDEIHHLNKSTKKLVLTESQKARVAKYYATDIEIFNSIKEPGQEFHFLKM